MPLRYLGYLPLTVSDLRPVLSQQGSLSTYNNAEGRPRWPQRPAMKLDARRRPSTVGGLPTPSGVFHGLVRLPTIPHRECLIVSGPSKILLRNATSTLSISESGAPVRGLRSKSRPFVICPELSIPIFFRNRFLSMFHRASM